MNKWVWFDMDGTLVDLYSNPNWLKELHSHNPAPYLNAKPIYEQRSLLRALSTLKAKGFKLGIISWVSKMTTTKYTREVKSAKIKWLKEHELYDLFDEILITSYGDNKSNRCCDYGRGVLVDDEEGNLDTWNLGETICAKEDILPAIEQLTI